MSKTKVKASSKCGSKKQKEEKNYKIYAYKKSKSCVEGKEGVREEKRRECVVGNDRSQQFSSVVCRHHRVIRGSRIKDFEVKTTQLLLIIKNKIKLEI